MVHEDLIKVYSSTFRELDILADHNEVHLKPVVDPRLFADFVSWLYTGRYPNDDGLLQTKTTGEHLWALGGTLKAPAFQNYVMDDCRRDYRKGDNHFMNVKSVTSLYKKTGPNTKLRKLVADIINFTSPLKMDIVSDNPNYEKNWKNWKELCKENSVIKAAVNKSRKRDGRDFIHGMKSSEMTTWLRKRT
jgi:hypothetical protein